MRAYVTGARGFVGTWLVRHLESCGDDVVPVDAEVDVLDGEAVAGSLTSAAPQVVYHLAGLAHVGRSWSDPVSTFNVNAIGTLNVVEAAAKCALPPRVIVVSSAEVYGGSAGPSPVTEEAELAPVTPYAASKIAAEYIGLQAFLGRGLPVIRVRPFNHVGPGQAADFVVSALARRVVEAERRGGGEVAVGNLSAERDFTDVRDVVVAYRLVAELGTAGQVYNVASGRGLRVEDLGRQLASLASHPVQLVNDPALERAVDVPVFIGDASSLRRETPWQPVIPLDQTLSDVLAWWRERLSA